MKNRNWMNSERWLPTKLIFKSNLKLSEFNCFPSDCFVQIDTTESPKFNFHFDFYKNEMPTLSLFVNNDHRHDPRIINLVVYVCVCAWGGGGVSWEWHRITRNVYKLWPSRINLPNWVILEIIGVENICSLKQFIRRVSWTLLGSSSPHKICWCRIQ